VPTEPHADRFGQQGSQNHRSGQIRRLGDAVSELRGGHSHDATDQIDDALEANAAGRRALFISLVGLGLTAALQAVVVLEASLDLAAGLALGGAAGDVLLGCWTAPL
jgi:hypothetical protein